MVCNNPSGTRAGMQATLEQCQERQNDAVASEMAACLANMPSKGFLQTQAAVSSSGRLYLCLHATEPPEGATLRPFRVSLADMYRTSHAKAQQQERPPLKRKASNQLLPPAHGGTVFKGAAVQPAMAPRASLEAAVASLSSRPAVTAALRKAPGSAALQTTAAAAAAAAAEVGTGEQPAGQHHHHHGQQRRLGDAGTTAGATVHAPASTAAGTEVAMGQQQQQQQQRHQPTGGSLPSTPQQQQQQRPPGANPKHQQYSLEQLNARSVKELGVLCAARSLASSGRKADLVQRLLDYQRRLRKACQPSC